MKQLGELTVADLMTRNPVCARASDRLTDALRRFEDYSISALPVVDDGHAVVGMLSLVDLLEVTRELHNDLSAMSLAEPRTRPFLIKLLAKDEDQTLVSDVMTQPVETVEPSTNAVLAAQRMLQGRFRHLPVVSDSGKVLGIVSATDFVRAFAQQAPLLAG